MPNYTKYQAYKKQRRAVGASTWEDVVPLTLSIDGDGTMRPIVLENPSEDCGYTPPIEPMYKWVDLDPSVDWICDEPQNNFKLKWTYRNGSSSVTECNDSLNLTEPDFCEQYEKENVTTVTIGDCVSGITDETFCGCYILQEIVIPNNVTYIENLNGYNLGLLQDCSGLTSVTLPNRIEFIENQMCFSCTSLTSIVIPDSVTEIRTNAFRYCSSLASVTFPTGLTTIGAAAFEHCTNLDNVILPSTVTSIGLFGFKDCTYLSSFICLATTPPTATDEFIFGNTPNLNIYVPSGSVNAYKAADGWKIFANKIFPIS